MPFAPPNIAILGDGFPVQAWREALAVHPAGLTMFDPDHTAQDHFVAHPAHVALAKICATISSAVADADLIVDCFPDRLALKRKALQRIQAHCPQGAVILSVSAEFDLGALQGCATRPEQILHLPRVEAGVLSNSRNAPEVVQKALYWHQQLLHTTSTGSKLTRP